jgi:hypothetical protein
MDGDTKSMSKRKAALWRKLVAEAAEAEIDAAASISVEQAEKDLAAWGFDVAAERAKAEAFLAGLEGRVSETRVKAAPPTELKPKK